jgi:hypothetical protein
MADGYHAEFSGTWYQWDPELSCLMPVRGGHIDPSRPAFTAPGLTDEELDQGDEPAELGTEWADVGYVTENPSSHLVDAWRCALHTRGRRYPDAP